MSDSEESGAGRWPQKERRKGERRAGRERRDVVPGRSAPQDPASSERRQAERRAATGRRDESGWKQIQLDISMATGFSPEEGLLEAAARAREFAQAHYSKFKVGAALETIDGVIVTGCNIENATYGLTLCAERVALVKALSDGHTAFTRIAVVADTQAPTPPCGPCRQLLWEYCGDIEVILANLDEIIATLRLSALLPMPFDARLLE